jgi:hypothetical protein
MTMKKFIILLVFAVQILFSVAATAQTGTIGGDMGIYRVHSNVNGAEVFFDGEYKGNITDNILDVPVYSTGTPYRSFTVEKEGYRPYTGVINSVPAKGQVFNLYATLSALPVVEYGTLHLVINPTFANVSYDGQEVGVIPMTGILDIRNVVPGNHVVQVSKEGYITNTTEVTVQKNEILKVFIVLQPLYRAALSVTSNPPGAQVELDGKTVGMTPLTFSDVVTGSHTLRISMTGFNDYEESVILTSEGGSVVANLTPLPTTPSGFGQIPLSPLLIIGAFFSIVYLYRKKTP